MGTCPLGGISGIENHFNTINEAQAFADKEHSEVFIQPELSTERDKAEEEMKILSQILNHRLQDGDLSEDEEDKIRTDISKQHTILRGASKEKKSIDELISNIGESDSGATFNMQAITPTTGFCASPYPEYSKVFDSSKEVSYNNLISYVSKIQDERPDLMNDKNTYIGLWNDPDDGKVYVDVSKHYNTASEARQACKENDQIAYFDLNMGESVTVNRNATSGQI